MRSIRMSNISIFDHVISCSYSSRTIPVPVSNAPLPNLSITSFEALSSCISCWLTVLKYFNNDKVPFSRNTVLLIVPYKIIPVLFEHHFLRVQITFYLNMKSIGSSPMLSLFIYFINFKYNLVN